MSPSASTSFACSSIASLRGQVMSHWSTDIQRHPISPFAAEVRDGKVFGRGTCDMKGGLAAAVIAVEALLETYPKLPGALEISARTDVYLLGSCLHEVLTGVPPHDAETVNEALRKAAHNRPLTYPDQTPDELIIILSVPNCFRMLLARSGLSFVTGYTVCPAQ